MGKARLPRRRSPYWVRQLSSSALHGIAGSMLYQQHSQDLSDRQEWLWQAVISELEYRRRRALRDGQRCCVCAFCEDPWDPS